MRPRPLAEKEGEGMRIEIKTKGKVTDPDIRALYMIVHALDNSTSRMKVANLQYVADKLGYKLVKKADGE
jgi:hypothetical protein